MIFSRYQSLAVFLLLVLFGTRLLAIDHYPVFIDETIHIYTAERLVNISPLLDVHLGRVGSVWWLWLFQPFASAPIWISRVAVLIAVLPGAAALMSIARRASGTYALLLMALFLIFSPYHFFFERLALADPIAASAVLVAVAAGYRLRDRIHYLDALLCGGFIAAAILAKTNALPYAGIVLAAAVGLRSWRSKERYEVGRWFIIAVSGLVVPLLAFEMLIRLTDNQWLGATFNYIASRSSSTEPLLTRILDNMQNALLFVSKYLHPVMFALLLVALVLALLHRRWYLLLVFAAPLLPLWIGEPQETRYWLVPVGLLGLIGAIEAAYVLRSSGWKWHAAVVVLLGLWGSLLWLPQVITTARQPINVPLPEVDRRQYVLSDAVGFGFEQIPVHIPAAGRPRILGLLSNCQGLRYTYLDQYEILCTRVNPDGSDVERLRQWVDEMRDTTGYAVLEDSPYFPDYIEAEVITVIQRQNNLANLTLYRLDPLE